MNGTVPFASPDRDFGVLTGFDGSEPARSAVQWAALAALGSGSALTVVTVYRLPPMMYTGEPAVLVAPEARADRDRAHQPLDVARELLRDYPGQATFLTAAGSRSARWLRPFRPMRSVLLSSSPRGIGPQVGRTQTGRTLLFSLPPGPPHRWSRESISPKEAARSCFWPRSRRSASRRLCRCSRRCRRCGNGGTGTRISRSMTRPLSFA